MILNTDFFEDILHRFTVAYADAFALLNTLHDIDAGKVQTYEESLTTSLHGHPAYDDLEPPAVDAVISMDNKSHVIYSKS